VTQAPSVWHAAILGVIQGLTEFLPVSSSGHLVILPQLFGWQNPPIGFDVAVHFGTLIALVCFYWSELKGISAALLGVLVQRGKPLSDETLAQARLGGLVLLACVPAGIAGVLFERFFESLFHGFAAVGVALLATGGILWISEGLRKGTAEHSKIGVWDAIWVGIAQSVAIVPGISRSGTTIAAGLLCGLGRKEAPRFAFLISIPVILGATVLSAYHMLMQGMPANAIAPYAVGIITAGVSGWVAIKVVLQAVVRGQLRFFSVYCWTVGSAVILLALSGRF